MNEKEKLTRISLGETRQGEEEDSLGGRAPKAIRALKRRSQEALGIEILKIPIRKKGQYSMLWCQKDGIKFSIPMHRLVMMVHIGRSLPQGVAIHHLNEVKWDNRVKNLLMVTSSEHTQIHTSGIKSFPWKECIGALRRLKDKMGHLTFGQIFQRAKTITQLIVDHQKSGGKVILQDKAGEQEVLRLI